MSVYTDRDNTLARMGFINYAAYLKSPLWKSIRKRVLEKANRKCCRCGRTAYQVHHSSYARDVLEGDNDAFLHAACGRCHHKAEINRYGEKTSIEQASGFLANKVGKAKKQAKQPARVLALFCYCGNMRKVTEDVCGLCLREPSLCSCGQRKKRNQDKCDSCQRLDNIVIAVDLVFGYDPNDEFSMPLF